MITREQKKQPSIHTGTLWPKNVIFSMSILILKIQSSYFQKVKLGCRTGGGVSCRLIWVVAGRKWCFSSFHFVCFCPSMLNNQKKLEKLPWPDWISYLMITLAVQLSRELPVSSGPISKLSGQKIQAEVSTHLNQWKVCNGGSLRSLRLQTLAENVTERMLC